MRPADDLHAFQVIRGEIAEVEGAAGFVEGNPIQQDLVVTALAAPDEERRDVAQTAGADDCGAGRRAQQVGDERRAASFDLVRCKNGQRAADLTRGDLAARGRDDDGLFDGPEDKRQVDRRARRGRGGGGETEQRRFHAAIAAG